MKNKLSCIPMRIEQLKTDILEFKIGKDKLVYVSPHATTYDTKTSKSDLFVKSKLYANIMEATSFFTPEIPVQFRIKCILTDSIEQPACPVCGKPCQPAVSLKSKTPCFGKTCGDTHCVAVNAASHIGHKSDEQKNNARTWMAAHKADLMKSYNNFIKYFEEKKYDEVEIPELKSYFKEKLEKQYKNGSIVKEKDFTSEYDKTMLANLISSTEFIELRRIKNKRDFEFSERIYCLLNDIRERPKCEFCGTGYVKFINARQGYASSCANCADEKYRKTIGYPSLPEIKKRIEDAGFEIISFPRRVCSEKLVIKCKTCGTAIERKINDGCGNSVDWKTACATCHPYEYTSNAENELLSFIRSIYGGEVRHNDRKAISPMEIDIYAPDKNIAVEYDGLYWHNDEKVKPGYHMLKTRTAGERGIFMVHVFENEWVNKNEIVKSRLKNLFGVYDRTIYARHCEIRDVRNDTAREFQTANHLQGPVNSSVNIGLFHGGELVSLMSFSKCRFDKTHEWELTRFCSKLGYHVVGGAGRLLKQFEKTAHPKSIVTYADRRWSVGKLYNALGFEHVGNSKTNYWYFNDYRNPVLKSRMLFQKHKLKSKLTVFDESKSEYENMRANGWHRIFDCGNMVFVKAYN